MMVATEEALSSNNSLLRHKLEHIAVTAALLPGKALSLARYEPCLFGPKKELGSRLHASGVFYSNFACVISSSCSNTILLTTQLIYSSHP